jgi:hypothetical protein
MPDYYKRQYEDIAEIIKSVNDKINVSLLSPNEILETFTNDFIGLFKTKGQSFNETRFLNAIKPNTPDDDFSEMGAV